MAATLTGDAASASPFFKGGTGRWRVPDGVSDGRISWSHGVPHLIALLEGTALSFAPAERPRLARLVDWLSCGQGAAPRGARSQAHSAQMEERRAALKEALFL